MGTLIILSVFIVLYILQDTISEILFSGKSAMPNELKGFKF